MQLDQLIHWRLEGTPDVFTEMRDGEEWRVIHSGGAIHQAGFMQLVHFDKPIKMASLSVVASLYTTGGGLMLRVGVQAFGLEIDWSSWYGPDNGWSGQPAQVLKHIVQGLDANEVTIYLESRCRHPVQANTSRWRDVQLEVEYLDAEPDPEPDLEKGLAGQIAAIQAEITEQLEQISVQVAEIDALLAEWTRAAAWVDNYNRSLIDE